MTGNGGTENGPPAAGGGRWSYRWRPWKVGAVIVAAFFLAAGGVLALVGGGGPGALVPEYPAASGTAPGPAPGPGARALLPGDTPLPGSPAPAEPLAEEPPSGNPWSPALLRGGISFFVAFILAFTFRTFLRIAIVLAGLWVASLFLLASAGWIEVHWEVIDAAFRGWSATIGDQFASVTSFLTGSLPSAGLAGLGLYTGFRKG